MRSRRRRRRSWGIGPSRAWSWRPSRASPVGRRRARHPRVERIWSPWRMAYIEAVPEPDEGCIFCDKPDAGDDDLAYILARAERAFVLLNTFPYNPGHLMVAPFRHVADLEELDDEEMTDISALLRRSVRALKDAVGPDGFNVGMNLGRVAGAGIPGHLHWHVVPRWSGDTNFMTVLGDVRVLPEGLAETYRRLKPQFSSDSGKRSAQPGPEAGNIQ